ncbi:MAG: rane protein [Thermomicrobiales bacterium]|nr:rane protein [Thermomicrobiales bacterium]
MKIAGVDVVATAKGTFKQFREDDLQGRSAEAAYNILFSIVPLLIFLTALSGFIARAAGVDDSMQRITTWLFEHMGTDQAQAVQEPIVEVVQSSNGGLLSFGAILALWGGKNAVASMMKALNVAFDVEESRPWPKRTAVAVGLTIALGLALTLTSAIFLAGSGIAADLTEKIGLGETWRLVWSIMRWPLIAAILIVAVSAFYWAAPNIDVPFKWLTPGSVLTVVLWGVATVALGFYFTHFAGYAGGAYGALGGVLAFIFWLNLMSLILLLGAELNSVLTLQAAAPAQKESPETVGQSSGLRREASGASTVSAADGPAASASLPVTSVPRGTYASDASATPATGGVRRSLSTLLAAAIVAVAKAFLKIRPYAARRGPAVRR